MEHGKKFLNGSKDVSERNILEQWVKICQNRPKAPHLFFLFFLGGGIKKQPPRYIRGLFEISRLVVDLKTTAKMTSKLVWKKKHI